MAFMVVEPRPEFHDNSKSGEARTAGESVLPRFSFPVSPNASDASPANRGHASRLIVDATDPHGMKPAVMKPAVMKPAVMKPVVMKPVL